MTPTNDGTNNATNDANTDATPTQIDLYWRPGCGFCSGLRRGLDKLGLERVEHNIWDDPNDAAIVRRHANGNETVPTVVIGDVGLVNPSPKQLVAHLAEHAPHLLPGGTDAASGAAGASAEGDRAEGRVGRFVGRVLGG